MNTDNTALLVDAVDGALAGAMPELDEFGFRVSWVPSLAPALEFIKTHPKLSLVVASSDATRAGVAEFLALRTFATDVRLIWGVRADLPSAALPEAPGERPDGVISEPFCPEELRAVITQLLAEQFYPTPM